MRDVLDALEEGVTVEQLHEIDRMLDEALDSKEPPIPADKFWDEFIPNPSPKANGP